MMLEIRDLSVTFVDHERPFTAVDHFQLQMDDGEVVGIVGESGSGKSMTAHAIMGLIDRSQVHVTGEIAFEGVDLAALNRAALRRYQGNELSIIFQEPMTSLDPTMRVGKQVEEALRLHTKLPKGERKARALAAMELAGLPDPPSLYRAYPHQLSGGMRQRVMIAAALVLRPRLLIADEPTTALDVTIQAQILDTLREINRREGTAILFISHDLGVIRALCQRVVVMRRGVIVEEGPVDQVFYHPQQEYTQRLIASRPTRKKLKGGAEDAQ
jgi:ABC-type dipeptide/oligopeptide/nickel transport system ATPase component